MSSNSALSFSDYAQEKIFICGQRKLSWWKICYVGCAEFLATATWVFIACMGCVEGLGNGTVIGFQKTLINGFGVMTAIHNFGHISGAHINPITTVCACILKATPYVLLPVYVIMQLLGAATGYGILKAVTPEASFPTSFNGTHGICVISQSPEISTIQAVGVELVISVILTFANCTAFDPRHADKLDTLSLKFAIIVAALSTVAGPYTGGGMNPARSFGPAVWNDDWTSHWIYWVSPVTASIIVSVFYRMVYMKPFVPR